MAGNGVNRRLTAAELTVGTGHQMSPALANSLRLTAVAERLAVNLQTAGDGRELASLCLSLARGIDFTLANNVVPSSVWGLKDLPRLLKQLCERRSDIFVQAAIMVLMISVKNACEIGWFPEDSEALVNLASEVANVVCCQGFANNRCSDPSSMLLTVISRFHPLMKLRKILSSLEIKPGYEAYLMDFHIPKNTGHSPQDKIHLFVVQTDNIETSACLISPQNVSFLLNGSGVEKRTIVSMDTGPQLPTNVTGMLKFGTNMVQAVGKFDSHYLIAVAFVSMTPILETPMLENYVPSGVPALDPDYEIIEGPSRISLNCPISHKRIRTPVKGKSCKHHQCFDFRSYVAINSKRPFWRCPDCNQPCCYTDIRVDQNITKVLQEVGEDVIDVFISSDGSWKAAFESDKLSHRQRSSTSAGDEGVAARPQTPSPQRMPRSNVIPGISDGPTGASQGRLILATRTSNGSSSASHGATFRGPVNFSQESPRSNLNQDQARSQVPSRIDQQEVSGHQIPDQPPCASAMSHGPPSGPRNLTMQQALRVPNSGHHVPDATQSPSPHNPVHSRQGNGQAGVAASAPANHQARVLSASSRATETARQPPFLAVQTASAADLYPVNASRIRRRTTEPRGNGGAVPEAPQPDVSMNSLSEQNWRPAGRMRGSISERDLATLKDFVIQPSQSSQAPRPPPSHLTPSSSRPSALPHLQASSRTSAPPPLLASSRTSAPPHLQASSRTSAPPHLQAFVNRNVQVPRPPSSSATEPLQSSGNSGCLPP